MATEEHDHGLDHDLKRFDRRRALFTVGTLAAGTLVSAACGKTDPQSQAAGGAQSASATSDSSGAVSSSASSGNSASSGDGDSSSCSPITEETAGPYPGDGSNGPNVLTESGVVRSDITTSFGSMSGTAPGEPLVVEMTILDVANGCKPYAGAAVYAWHCDREGNYSLYSRSITDQNYLRGVQVADADGKVRFSTIFPACYSGRWPHVHFEVYPDVDSATNASKKLATSQIALPEDLCNEIYANSEGYSKSVTNLSRVSLASDNVFSDGWSRELGTASGSVGKDLTISLTIPV